MKVPKNMFLIFALLTGTQSFAQEQISGPQSGTLGPGTYIVVGDILVLSGETLNIVPGTEFRHTGNYAWEIFGQLNALGAEADSIFFVRDEPIEAHKWKGIRFQAGASDASIIDYCVIDYCYVNSGLLPPYLYGGGIYTNGVSITISNTKISNCEAFWHGGAIYADGADILVDNCLIVDNTAIGGANGGGILLYNCNNAVIQNSVIAHNSATGD